MKLEVGKTYMTRDGEAVTITDYNSKDSPYCYSGTCSGHTESWTADGRFHVAEACFEYDLVKEVQDAEAPAEAPRPTPAMRQQAIFEAMDFRIGDKVVIGARIERTNGEQYPWHYRMQVLMHAEAVGTITRIIKYGRTDTVEVTFDSHDRHTTWTFLPQCLEHYTPESENIKLNDYYAAVVTPGSDEIKVGCWTLGIDKVREVLAAWEKLSK